MGEKDSPYPFLLRNVDRLHAEQITFEQFLNNLDVTDSYLQHWSARLAQLKLPTGLASAQNLLNGINEAVEMFWQASGELREIETHEDEERLEAALQIAQDGHDRYVEVLRATAQTLEEF